MSDDLMIRTIEKMQIELRRALADVQLLTDELKRNASQAQPVGVTTEKPKKVIKLKNLTPVAIDEVKKKHPTGIVTWNAFLSQIRGEMQQLSEEKVKNEDVIAKATATKMADPEGYKAFCASWLAAHPQQ